jgi:hypothetical protein
MMITREEYEKRLQLALDVVRAHKGISTYTLARAIGIPLPTTKRFVRTLIVDGLIRFDTTRTEEREVQRGPRPYLLVPVR